MSVLITGLDMPKANEQLCIDINPDGKVCIALDLQCRKVAQAIQIQRPHGRLIDADALRQSIKESIDECYKWANEVEGGEMYVRVSQTLGTFVECSLRVKAEPTIIPASEEGDVD